MDIQLKNGEVTGTPLYKVVGVDMAWQSSEEIAINVAERILKISEAPDPVKNEPKTMKRLLVKR